MASAIVRVCPHYFEDSPSSSSLDLGQDLLVHAFVVVAGIVAFEVGVVAVVAVAGVASSPADWLVVVVLLCSPFFVGVARHVA